LKIHTNLNKFSVQKPVVTIGIFDGVHIGHKKVIKRLIKLSREVNGESVLITFWPHPRSVLNFNHTNLKYLNTLEEKKLIIERTGIDHLVIVPFTPEFSKLSPDDFIKEILVNKIGIKYFVIGFNHQFGKNREGNINNLKELGIRYKFKVEQLDAEIVEEEMVSSTNIRDALEAGDLEKANKYLGYDFFMDGKIVGGERVGRSIGFPTANIQVSDIYKLIPKNGVYAVEVLINKEYYKGMLNIGIRPTINHPVQSKSIEVHIIDFNQNIYDQTLTIFLKKRIRDEKKFQNSEMLVWQLIKDKEEVIKIFNKA